MTRVGNLLCIRTFKHLPKIWAMELNTKAQLKNPITSYPIIEVFIKLQKAEFSNSTFSKIAAR